jgi:hypothetical protein
MNTQIEFDEDNKTFGFEEWEYLNFRSRSNNRINETIIDELEKQNEQLVVLKKFYLESQRKLKKLQKEIYEKDELLEKAEKINAVHQYELNLVEEVCFKNSNPFYPYSLPENTLAFRIRKRLVEIKIELNKKAKLSSVRLNGVYQCQSGELHQT